MRIKFITIIALIAFSGSVSQAQVEMKSPNSYGFTSVKTISCTPVKSQDRTGTCWSFATSSFLESEAIRMGHGPQDFSEMYVVRNVYKDKARNYVMRQGKANFSQGSLSHDLIRVIGDHGMVPESIYSGKLEGDQKHDHSEMAAVLKGMLDGVLKQKRLSKKWMKAFDAVVDTYLGETPQQFTYDGKKYSANSYAKEMGLDADNYVNITSFTHHPFYEKFVLEIPDNYSNGSFYNLPIEDVQKIVENAIDKGYSVAWDGDVSEKGFSSKNGMAIIPEDAEREDLFVNPGKEKMISQEMRQEQFESYATTDDHLMHLTGISKDKKGTKYFLIKNSWGEVSEYKGYLYMSEAYLQLKTVAILVHKDAIPARIKNKMK
ncbi:MAG: C1 family peptidase [Saprospiraceae bacterium]